MIRLLDKTWLVYKQVLTGTMDTLEEVLVKGSDGDSSLDGWVVLEELLGAENASTGLALTWNGGAVGDNDRVHLLSGHDGGDDGGRYYGGKVKGGYSAACVIASRNGDEEAGTDG